MIFSANFISVKLEIVFRTKSEYMMVFWAKEGSCALGEVNLKSTSYRQDSMSKRVLTKLSIILTH